MAKLDKIKFANVIAHISECVRNQTIDKHDIQILDELIDIEAEQPPAINPEQLHVLMALMQEGERKIEAIKQHRMMTGYGLKESKDIVEKYWPNSYSKEKLCNKLNLYAANDAEHSIIAKFIEKLI